MQFYKYIFQFYFIETFEIYADPKFGTKFGKHPSLVFTSHEVNKKPRYKNAK